MRGCVSQTCGVPSSDKLPLAICCRKQPTNDTAQQRCRTAPAQHCLRNPTRMAHTATADAKVVLHNCDVLTGKELTEVMQANEKWPQPADKDGWMLAHNCIRHDMEAIRVGMETTLQQVQGGRPMEPWQAANLAKFFPNFVALVHGHHEMEEETLFPYLSTRFALPPKMSADHANLMAVLDDCAELAKSMKATGDAEQDAVEVQAFLDAFKAMEVPMREHLKEEEEVAMPNMRRYFSHQDLDPLVKKAMGKAPMQDVAHAFQHIESMEEKKVVMSELRIPALVQYLVVLPACRRYSKQWQRLLDELKAGRQMPTSSWGFLWF